MEPALGLCALQLYPGTSRSVCREGTRPQGLELLLERVAHLVKYSFSLFANCTIKVGLLILSCFKVVLILSDQSRPVEC